MSSWHDIIEKSCMFLRSHIKRCFCIRRILRVQFLKYAKIIFTESVNMPAGRVNAHPAGWTEIGHISVHPAGWALTRNSFRAYFGPSRRMGVNT